MGNESMSRFAGGREAKEFLVARIVAEAQREGVSLSEIERKMLYFSETDWTLPDIDKVSEAFERQYDNDEYEKKIASLIHNARVRARKEDKPEFEAWSDAIRILSKEDHYLLVMIDQAGSSSGPPGDLVKLWATGILVVCICVGLPFFFFTRFSYRTDRRGTRVFGLGSHHLRRGHLHSVVCLFRSATSGSTHQQGS
jgi:hypothetical protein